MQIVVYHIPIYPKETFNAMKSQHLSSTYGISRMIYAGQYKAPTTLTYIGASMELSMHHPHRDT